MLLCMVSKVLHSNVIAKREIAYLKNSRLWPAGPWCLKFHKYVHLKAGAAPQVILSITLKPTAIQTPDRFLDSAVTLNSQTKLGECIAHCIAAQPCYSKFIARSILRYCYCLDSDSWLGSHAECQSILTNKTLQMPCALHCSTAVLYSIHLHSNALLQHQCEVPSSFDHLRGGVRALTATQQWWDALNNTVVRMAVSSRWLLVLLLNSGLLRWLGRRWRSWSRHGLLIVIGMVRTCLVVVAGLRSLFS